MMYVVSVLFSFVFVVVVIMFCFLFKQKTAYEMRISDWSSDVCSSDLLLDRSGARLRQAQQPDRSDRGLCPSSVQRPCRLRRLHALSAHRAGHRLLLSFRAALGRQDQRRGGLYPWSG